MEIDRNRQGPGKVIRRGNTLAPGLGNLSPPRGSKSFRQLRHRNFASKLLQKFGPEFCKNSAPPPIAHSEFGPTRQAQANKSETPSISRAAGLVPKVGAVGCIGWQTANRKSLGTIPTSQKTSHITWQVSQLKPLFETCRSRGIKGASPPCIAGPLAAPRPVGTRLCGR